MSKFLRIGVTVGAMTLAAASFHAITGDSPRQAQAPFAAAFAAEQAEGEARKFGLGRPALPEELAAWDIDVRPDGEGLPEGSGTVAEGEEIYLQKCASCHGDFGEGIGRWPALSGGGGTLSSEDPVKTVGSYWPFLSTVYDYVHRAMPFGNAQSLSDDEVYALTAYILYLNFIVEDYDFELSKDNFTEITLPNEGQFFVDDREEVEFEEFKREPCMKNCKESVEITMRARVLDVTPEDEAARKEREAASEETQVAAAEGASEPDPALVEEGEKVFRQCKACHQVGEGAENRVGPHLNGVVGRDIAAVDGFRYSPAFQSKAEEGFTWTEETLAAYLKDPRGYIEGNRMAYPGLKDEDDLKAVIAYLKTFEE
ncbi:c-type cytochrome [Dichotomicrobium thermohalophilum]|uniref:Sulfur dehydrogenase subunit SoxD n=1 Tax=Dichotomicrobium thermohalophilum TaxID=933063 RepID=A0A397Q4U7_9HYPH|nr:c-type cytochrome [Dichotomicrobium thermohalophilum]RIA56068.1 sulfur dehydrogenase subunit SoxD [Dichotomicrobium thermohalophilum]